MKITISMGYLYLCLLCFRWNWYWISMFERTIWTVFLCGWICWALLHWSSI